MNSGPDHPDRILTNRRTTPGPDGIAGIADIAGLAGITGLGAYLAFGVLAWVVLAHGGAPLGADRALLTWSLGHRPDMAVALARGVTRTGTGLVPYVLAALAGVVVGRSSPHRLRAAALSVVCLAAGQAMRYGVMELVHRNRPAPAGWAAGASGWAFPSGHSTTAALTAGLLIVAVSSRAPRGATAFRVVVGCWGVLVGLSRVYLGVHWFTDVVGGWLFATGWLGVCLYATARWLPASSVAGPPSTPRTPRTTRPPRAPRAPEEPAHDHPPRDPDHPPRGPGRQGRSGPP